MFRQPWLGLLVELGTLGPTEHDLDLQLAVFGQPEHRARVQPVLSRQAIDSQPAVRGPRRCPSSARNEYWPASRGSASSRPAASGTEVSTAATRAPTRPPRRRQLALARRLLNAVRAASAPYPPGDVLGYPPAGLYRRPTGISVVDPARRRLHGQGRGIAVAQRSVLPEVGDADDYEVGD